MDWHALARILDTTRADARRIALRLIRDGWVPPPVDSDDSDGEDCQVSGTVRSTLSTSRTRTAPGPRRARSPLVRFVEDPEEEEEDADSNSEEEESDESESEDDVGLIPWPEPTPAPILNEEDRGLRPPRSPTFHASSLPPTSSLFVLEDDKEDDDDDGVASSASSDSESEEDASSSSSSESDDDDDGDDDEGDE